MSDQVTSNPIMQTQGFSPELMFELMDEFKRALKNLAFQNAKIVLVRMQTNVPGLKSIISRMKNTVLSVSEGLSSEAITKEQAARELKDALEDFEDAYRHQISALANPSKDSFDEELRSRLRPGSLDVFAKDKDSLQRALLKSGIYVGYAPVLAIAGPSFNPNKLQKSGIPAESFAGYTILKKQFVAGLALSYIDAHLPNMSDGRPSKKKDALSKEELVKEFKEVLLSKYRNLHLADAADPITWYGAMWFWMVSSVEYKTWQSCTISDTKVNSVAVKKWSFPF